MLKIQSADGHEHLIAHLRSENIHTLVVIQMRFNGEVALWCCKKKEWIPIADFLFDTAREVEAV